MIREGCAADEEEIAHLKAAIWALGHLGSTELGLEHMKDVDSTETGTIVVLSCIAHLAKTCQVYSVRGTCFYALSLVASTQTGADALQSLSEPQLSFQSEFWYQ